MRSKIVSVMFIMMLLLSGCSTSKPSEVIQSQALNKGNELVLAIGGEPSDGFDPTRGWGRYGSPLFQSTLFKKDNDLNIIEDIATEYSVSEDGLSYTVTIRSDIVFSDGTPLTAEDVAFTYRTAQESSSVVDLTMIETIQQINQYSVLFQLNKPFSPFIDLLTTIGIVPAHAYNDQYGQQPVGSGPYKLVQWDRGQQLIVEKNELYYGEQSFFERLVFLFLDEDAAFAAAKAGTVDIAAIPSSFSKQTVAGMVLKGVATVDNRGIMFPYVPSGATTEQGHAIGNDVTSDLAIRQAINYGINRELLVEGILEGYGTPAYTLNDKLPWWNENTVIEDGNIAHAQALLKEAGWKDADGDGIVEKEGLTARFTLVYPSGDTIRQSLSIAVSDMVKSIGIQIDVEGKSWEQIETLMYSNAIMFGFGSNDPLELFNVYSSTLAGVDYYNSGYYSNEVVDQYLNAALTTIDQDEAMENWKKAQWDGSTGFSVQGDAPWAWLVNIDHLYVIDENLDIGEQPIHPHGHGWPITSNIEQWRWVD